MKGRTEKRSDRRAGTETFPPFGVSAASPPPPSAAAVRSGTSCRLSRRLLMASGLLPLRPCPFPLRRILRPSCGLGAASIRQTRRRPRLGSGSLFFRIPPPPVFLPMHAVFDLFRAFPSAKERQVEQVYNKKTYRCCFSGFLKDGCLTSPLKREKACNS